MKLSTFPRSSNRVRAASFGFLAAATLTLVAASSEAAPTFKTVSGWKQFYAGAFGEVAEDWESPLVGASNTNLLDVAFLGSGTSDSCATAPAQNFMSGACYGQCVELTDRWFVKFVYKKVSESKSKIWGNGGDPICKCAAGTDGCATDASLFTVYWPGNSYVPMTGDVLSFSYTHAALVTNVWTDSKGTHLGYVQQNVSAVNVIPWLGDHFTSESCIIHAKELVCADEAALPNPAPAGAEDALVFACGDERRTTVTGDWSNGQYKAECGIGEAMTGLSMRTQFDNAHAAVCGAQDASLLHTTDACHAVDFSGKDAEPAGAADWDSGYHKGLCNDDEYVAGVSQTSDSRLHSILCCKGEGLTHDACETQVFAAGDAREMGTSGDWDVGKFKGECGPGRFVTGVSATADGTSKPHAIQCCGGIAPPPPPPSTAQSTGSGVGGGTLGDPPVMTAGTGGSGGGSPAASVGGGAEDDTTEGSCSIGALPGGEPSGIGIIVAAAIIGIAARRRRQAR